ncbi:MAG: hypothetical protein JF888_00120 [Candidatus Dormibacteraeota bacterium]|uniref:Uncharacterized protein n=1 Tax=Candidatus Dormiibacter inghamiae TaxID=3127013 RepID=A0A934K7U3_9BACT|nr:hypothetical protein [Candidatus Dormibacteraeota bacterium]MBJ7606808.1 hypothetical protein [Candidatus Dormibacteraeota bacterium]
MSARRQPAACLQVPGLAVPAWRRHAHLGHPELRFCCRIALRQRYSAIPRTAVQNQDLAHLRSEAAKPLEAGSEPQLLVQDRHQHRDGSPVNLDQPVRRPLRPPKKPGKHQHGHDRLASGEGDAYQAGLSRRLLRS